MWLFLIIDKLFLFKAEMFIYVKYYLKYSHSLSFQPHFTAIFRYLPYKSEPNRSVFLFANSLFP